MAGCFVVGGDEIVPVWLVVSVLVWGRFAVEWGVGSDRGDNLEGLGALEEREGKGLFSSLSALGGLTSLHSMG